MYQMEKCHIFGSYLLFGLRVQNDLKWEQLKMKWIYGHGFFSTAVYWENIAWRNSSHFYLMHNVTQCNQIEKIENVQQTK